MDLNLSDIYHYWALLKNFVALDTARLMQTDMIVRLGLQVLLLAGSAFFSGAEIALVNSDKIRLHHKASQGHNGAKLILKMFKTPDVILGTTLVGTNISTVVLATLGTLLMIRYFGEQGDLYAFLVYTPVFLILGEIVPKSVYQQKSHTIGGLVMARLRHIPKEGEFIEEAGCRFTVEQATERSVVKLRVERIGI